MKRIIISFVTACFSIAIFVGAAFAVRAVIAPASAGGITFACGNPSLQIYNENVHGWRDSWSPSFKFDNLIPGATQEKTFILKNNSTSGVTFFLTATIHHAHHRHDRDWDILKNVINIEISQSEKGSIGFQTLARWSEHDFVLPGGPLAAGDKRTFHFNVTVNPHAGNEIARRLLDNIDFYFTGTQTVLQKHKI